MTVHMMGLTAERCRMLLVLLLLMALVATACGGAPAAQAPVRDVSTAGGEPQGPLSGRNDSAAALPALQPNTDSVPDAATVTYRVGQTAAIGSLRVTVDKVVTSAGEAGNLPQAGKRFLFVHITVENTGQAAQSLNFLATSVMDQSLRHYFVYPYADLLSAARPLYSDIPPGGRMSGNRGYMLPKNAGDLIWTMQDPSHNRATFAVSTTDIVALYGR